MYSRRVSQNRIMSLFQEPNVRRWPHCYQNDLGSSNFWVRLYDNGVIFGAILSHCKV